MLGGLTPLFVNLSIDSSMKMPNLKYCEKATSHCGTLKILKNVVEFLIIKFHILYYEFIIFLDQYLFLVK